MTEHPYIQHRKMVHRDLEVMYGRQLTRVEHVLDEIDEISPGLMLTLCDSFAPRNRDHHGWVADTLAQHIVSPATITVLGSGVGLMFGLRLKHTFPKAKITMIDYNPWICHINEMIDMDNELSFVCADVVFDDVSEYLGADLVINASCDNMWPMTDMLPKMKTYCMLSTNMEYVATNRNCVFDVEEFVDQLKPQELLYAGEYNLTTTDRLVLPNSKRFMVIGQTTQRD